MISNYTLWFDLGKWITESVVIFCMYRNAIANNVMLKLWHNFYNTVFKLKSYIFSQGQLPPIPPIKNSVCVPQ
jgi:hypothetical protein